MRLAINKEDYGKKAQLRDDPGDGDIKPELIVRQLKIILKLKTVLIEKIILVFFTFISLYASIPTHNTLLNQNIFRTDRERK